MSNMLIIITLVSLLVAVLALGFASQNLFRRYLAPWLARERRAISEALDLAGFEAEPKILSMLSLIGPVSRLVLKILYKRRIVAADKQLPDLLALLGNALKAGLAINQAVDMAAMEMDGALGFELKRAAAQMKLGQGIEDALGAMAQRLATDDIGLFVQSVEVLRRTGGNLVETFSTLLETIEERQRTADRIRVLTAEGLYQGIVLLLMPWGLGFLLQMIAPDYIEPLIGTRVGLFFLAAGILLEILGAVWLKKIVMIRV